MSYRRYAILDIIDACPSFSHDIKLALAELRLGTVALGLGRSRSHRELVNVVESRDGK